MRLIIFLLFSLATFYASAQDLSGIWRGHFKSSNLSRLLDTLGFEDRYKFETQLEQKDKAFEGVTYSYKTTVFYGKASCFGALNPVTKKVLLEETRLLEVRSEGGGACLMTCFLQYSKVGNEEFLEGTYTSMSLADSSQCGGGTVFLRKVLNSDFYKEPFLDKEKPKVSPPVAKSESSTPKTNPQSQKPVIKPAKPAPPKTTEVPKKQTIAAAKPKVTKPPVKSKPDLKEIPKKSEALKQLPDDTTKKSLSNPVIPGPVPRVLVTRQNELVKTITTSAKEVSIKIYDNGTIDNDTVSVYVDKKLVISKQRLTDMPITVKIKLDDNTDFHELIMVAENLGEIPPNTSLMVVNAGDQQYEVRITSTEQKNAVVHFRYEKG